MTHLRTLLAALAILLLASCAAPAPALTPAAQLERFEIVSRAPAFGGAVFGDVGAYETVVAVAHLRIDPQHPANRVIVDLDKAPAPGGWVSYKTDVILLRPRDPAKASRVLLLDIPNRGNKLFQYMVNEVNPLSDGAAGAGTGYAMRQGHTLVWIGWQGNIPLAANGAVAGAEFPVATQAGQPITGQSQEEAVFDDIQPVSAMRLSYPAAALDQGGATLTVRPSAMAAPTLLAAASWRYKSASEIELTRPPGFDAGAIYQFRYQARDPKVMGLGMAALRDVTSFLKSGAADAAGQPNPLADMRPEVALALGVSQSGRFLRDLIWQGFNADPRGGKVFDGAMPLIAGSRKSFVNARFAQPGRFSTQHLDHITYGDQFPFSYGVTTDPVSGATDGIFARCRASASCPKLMHVDSSLEFWQARASLVVTDGAGKDITLPDDVRAYLLSSAQHGPAYAPTDKACKYPNNAAWPAPLVRALIEDLAAWARSGKEPPASRFPRIGDALLTAPQREAVGSPDLRAIGVAYPQVINELTLVDYRAGAVGRPDPARRYELLVPMADQDGHDIAGIRSPDIAAPLATHTGWNLRRDGFAEGQLCGLSGMQVPFPKIPREGDPRRAIAQRYPAPLDYAKAVALAARDLRDQGLLLAEDANRYIERARAYQP